MPVDRYDPLARSPETSVTSRSNTPGASTNAEAIEIVLEVEDVEVVPSAARRRMPPPPPAAALSAPPAAGRRSMVVPTSAAAPESAAQTTDANAPRPRRRSHSTWPGVQPPVAAEAQPPLKRPSAPDEMGPLNSSPSADVLKRAATPARPSVSANSPAPDRTDKPEPVPVYLQLEAELERKQADMDRLARQMRARDAYLLELERALADSQALLHSLGVHDAESASLLTGQLRGQAFRIAELEAELQRRDRTQLEPERHTEVRPRPASNRAAG